MAFQNIMNSIFVFNYPAIAGFTLGQMRWSLSRGAKIQQAALTVSAHVLKGITDYYTVFDLCLTMEQMGRNAMLPQSKLEAIQRPARPQDQIERVFHDMRRYLDAHATG